MSGINSAQMAARKIKPKKREFRPPAPAMLVEGKNVFGNLDFAEYDLHNPKGAPVGATLFGGGVNATSTFNFAAPGDGEAIKLSCVQRIGSSQDRGKKKDSGQEYKFSAGFGVTPVVAGAASSSSAEGGFSSSSAFGGSALPVFGGSAPISESVGGFTFTSGAGSTPLVFGAVVDKEEDPRADSTAEGDARRKKPFRGAVPEAAPDRVSEEGVHPLEIVPVVVKSDSVAAEVARRNRPFQLVPAVVPVLATTEPAAQESVLRSTPLPSPSHNEPVAQGANVSRTPLPPTPQSHQSPSVLPQRTPLSALSQTNGLASLPFQSQLTNNIFSANERLQQAKEGGARPRLSTPPPSGPFGGLSGLYQNQNRPISFPSTTDDSLMSEVPPSSSVALWGQPREMGSPMKIDSARTYQTSFTVQPEAADDNIMSDVVEVTESQSRFQQSRAEDDVMSDATHPVSFGLVEQTQETGSAMNVDEPQVGIDLADICGDVEMSDAPSSPSWGFEPQPQQLFLSAFEIITDENDQVMSDAPPPSSSSLPPSSSSSLPPTMASTNRSGQAPARVPVAANAAASSPISSSSSSPSNRSEQAPVRTLAAASATASSSTTEPVNTSRSGQAPVNALAAASVAASSPTSNRIEQALVRTPAAASATTSSSTTEPVNIHRFEQAPVRALAAASATASSSITEIVNINRSGQAPAHALAAASVAASSPTFSSSTGLEQAPVRTLAAASATASSSTEPVNTSRFGQAPARVLAAANAAASSPFSSSYSSSSLPPPMASNNKSGQAPARALAAASTAASSPGGLASLTQSPTTKAASAKIFDLASEQLHLLRDATSSNKNSSNPPMSNYADTMSATQVYFAQMGEAEDPAAQAGCPPNFSAEQKVQFFAAYRIRALNKGMKEYMRALPLGGDPSSALQHYSARTNKIALALETGIAHLKRKRDEIEQESTPSKKSKSVDIASKNQHAPQKPSLLKTQPVLNSAELGTASLENSAKSKDASPAKAALFINSSTTPRVPPSSQPLFSTEKSFSPAPASSSGKRKAEVQLTKDGDEDSPSKKVSQTANVLKDMLEKPSPGPRPRSPERTILSPRKPQSPEKSRANPFGVAVIPDETLLPPTSPTKSAAFSPTRGTFGSQFGTPAKPTNADKPTTSETPKSIFVSNTSGITSGTGNLAPKPTNSESSKSIFASDTSDDKSGTGNSASKPTNSTSSQSISAPKSTSGYASSSSAASGSSIKPPTFATSGTNFLAQFGTTSKKSMEDAEKSAMERAKLEDMDSDEDETEWEANYKKKREIEKKATEELVAKNKKATFVPGKGFSFNAAESPAETTKTASKSIFDQSGTTTTSSTNLFAPVNRSETSSPGAASSRGSSIFDGNTAPKPAALGGANIFGHLSDVESGVDSGKGNDADDDASDGETGGSDEGNDENDVAYDLKKDETKTSDGPSTPLEETGSGIASAKKPTAMIRFGSSDSNSGTSTPGGSLFDRISRDSNGNPIRQIPLENEEDPLLTPGQHLGDDTSIKFGRLGKKSTTDATRTPQDNTWKQDSPIKFGNSTPTPPSVQITAPTPTRISPFTGLFGSTPPKSSSPTPTGTPFTGFSMSTSANQPASPAPTSNPSGGLFGNTSASSGSTNSFKPSSSAPTSNPSGGIFGKTSTTFGSTNSFNPPSSVPTSNPSGGIFGKTSTTSGSTNPFNQPSSAPTSNPSGGIFGNTSTSFGSTSSFNPTFSTPNLNPPPMIFGNTSTTSGGTSSFNPSLSVPISNPPPMIFGNTSTTPGSTSSFNPTFSAPNSNPPTMIFGNTSAAFGSTSSFNPTFSAPNSNPSANNFGNNNATRPASSLFASLNSENKPATVGFGFGGAPSTTTSSLFPSAVGSNNNSRATTPGGTTDGETNDENADPDAEHHEQIDLTSGGPGEENETVLHQVRAKALKFETSKEDGKTDWVVKGLGPLRILKDNYTGATRVLIRSDPRGIIVLNKGVLGNVRYEATGKTVKLLTAGEGGQGLETWIIQVKTPEAALELANYLEENKRKD